MNTMIDDIMKTTSQLRGEIHDANWGVTGRTLDEVAGLVVEALLQADDEGVMCMNNTTALAYADLVATQGVTLSAGPQGLADQIVGLSRVFAAVLRKRRTPTESEGSLDSHANVICAALKLCDGAVQEGPDAQNAVAAA